MRLGSVYGISSDSTRLNIMPNLFSKIHLRNFDVNFKGEQFKSLVSVSDVARCLQFVGEDDISNEIFNCVNENLQVKKVASICKKHNKNLIIENTNDEIPNKGYTLSIKAKVI